MARRKIDYGIDLGTTNSSIARMENGKPIIRKSPDFQKDTTPSCVHFDKKGRIWVGDRAANNFFKEIDMAYQSNDEESVNTFREFKREMGTDRVYTCMNMENAFTPEDLSAEVLKALKGYIRDDSVNSAVITVPAKFLGYQKDATKKSADLAGIPQSVLLQEPIAASMAYGINTDTVDGYWIVFDFGGGTFDVALMRAEEGIMKVVDTEGSNHLGGKNIDYAIVDQIIIPHLQAEYTIDDILSDEKKNGLLRRSLKGFAEDAKINLSREENSSFNILTVQPIGEDENGLGMEIDLTITREDFNRAVKPIFQEALDITKKLIENNKLKINELTDILMVGGTTLSETLRKMVREQISQNINISLDPMTVVAKGAALYASTKDISEDIIEKDRNKVQLTLKYPSNTVEEQENLGIRVNREETEGELPEKLFVEVKRKDKGWDSGKIELKEDAEVITINLKNARNNEFELTITDEKGNDYPAEPDSFDIIQGFRIAGQTLTDSICIDAFEISKGRQHLVELHGLKKNQPLPAKGRGIFRTQRDIRPGKAEDKIRIPLYEGEKGTRAIYNHLRGVVNISGEQLSGFLPENSEVEVRVEVDDEEIIKVEVSFPYLDGEIVDDVISEYKRTTEPKDNLEREINKTKETLDNLEKQYPDLDRVKVEELRHDLNRQSSLLKSGGNDPDTRNQVHDNILDNLKNIDVLRDSAEWPKRKNELIQALENIKSTNEQFGDEETSKLIASLERKGNSVIQSQNSKMAEELTSHISSLDFAITDEGAGVALDIGMVKGFDESFDTLNWKNRSRALDLIDQAKNIIFSNRATKANLRPLINELVTLLPMEEREIIKPDDDVLFK